MSFENHPADKVRIKTNIPSPETQVKADLVRRPIAFGARWWRTGISLTGVVTNNSHDGHICILPDRPWPQGPKFIPIEPVHLRNENGDTIQEKFVVRPQVEKISIEPKLFESPPSDIVL